MTASPKPRATTPGWVAADMDEGILRREPTRRAAVHWFRNQVDASVTRRVSGREGSYEYEFINPGEDDAESAFIIREDRLERAGFDPSQAALYPLPDEPFTYVDRVIDEKPNDVPAPRGNTPRRTIRIPDDEWEAAQETAERRGEILSQVIRAQLRGYVKRNKLKDGGLS